MANPFAFSLDSQIGGESSSFTSEARQGALGRLLKAVGEPGGEIVHVPAGCGFIQERSGEEMSVIGGKGDMPVETPFQQRLRLVAHAAGIAGFPGLNQINRRPVNAVVDVLPPEAIPIEGQSQVFEQGQIELGMEVDVIRGADQGGLAKVSAAGKQRVEGLKIGVLRVVVAAGGVGF